MGCWQNYLHLHFGRRHFGSLPCCPVTHFLNLIIIILLIKILVIKLNLLLIVKRYWTKLFVVMCTLSYILVFPFVIIYPYVEKAINYYDSAQYGIAEDLFSTVIFWYIIISVYLFTFGFRYYYCYYYIIYYYM